MPTTPPPDLEERTHALVREAVRQAKADRDAYWQQRIGEYKVLLRSTITLHAPKESDRYPRWTRCINALFAGAVRVFGPF